MRTTLSICLAVAAAGCASTRSPEPRASSVQAGDVPVLLADSVKHTRIEVMNTACETHDPMAVRLPLSVPGEVAPKNAPAPGAMPNGATPHPLPYIPNACPVTAGPLAERNVPAVLRRPGKRAVEPAQP